MTENQDTVMSAPGAISGSSQDSASHSPSLISSIMDNLAKVSRQTEEVQSAIDTPTPSNKSPNRRAQRAERAQERAMQEEENAKKAERHTKKAQKHARKAEKHSRKAEKSTREAESKKAASNIARLVQKAKEHAQTALEHAANAEKYVQTAQASAPQSEKDTSRVKAAKETVSKKKRGREEDEGEQLPLHPKKRQKRDGLEHFAQAASNKDQPLANTSTREKRSREEEDTVQDQPHAKKHRPTKKSRKQAGTDSSRSRRDSSIEEGEIVEDEPISTQPSKEKDVHQDEDGVENTPPSKRKRRSRKAAKAANTINAALNSKRSADVSQKVPEASKKYLDYIKSSKSAKLRSMELELKRRLQEQEQANYVTRFDTNALEHCRQVTLTLLQKIQAELKTRKDAAPPKIKSIHPVSFSNVGDDLPYALTTLYRMYRNNDLTSFTCFGKLPAELRIEIWKLAEDRRIVKVEMVRSANGTSGSIISRTEPASIFLACHESREVALKLYKPLPPPFNFRLAIPIPILVDYRQDTIYHHRSLFREAEIFKHKNVVTPRSIIKVDRLICDLDKVRGLAFDAHLPQQKNIPSLGTDINHCKSLEKLTLVLGETYAAHLIDKGTHCPIIKGYSFLNRLSRPPLLYGIKRLKNHNYMRWDVDASKLGAEGSVRGKFREILSKERDRETGAIQLLENFHKEAHLFKRQWEEGPKKKAYPGLCKCHMPQHEKIMAVGTSTYDPTRNTRPLGEITPEDVLAVVPCGGITRAELVDKLNIRSYPIDFQIEFYKMSWTVLFKSEDEKLRPKKDGPLDITPEKLAASIPVGGVSRNDLYRSDYIPPQENKQRSKWEKKNRRLLPLIQHFSTFSAEAKQEFLDMVDSVLILAADGKLKLRENRPFDIKKEEVLNAVPPEGITNKEIYTVFNMEPYSLQARTQFKELLRETLVLRKDQRLYPRREASIVPPVATQNPIVPPAPLFGPAPAPLPIIFGAAAAPLPTAFAPLPIPVAPAPAPLLIQFVPAQAPIPAPAPAVQQAPAIPLPPINPNPGPVLANNMTTMQMGADMNVDMDMDMDLDLNVDALNQATTEDDDMDSLFGE